MSTISIRYMDIPHVLRAGDFYRSLDKDDPDGTIEIPAGCFSRDFACVSDSDAFCQLVRTALFWLLDGIPQGVLYFCIHNRPDVWQSTISTVPNAIESKYFAVLFATCKKRNMIDLAGIMHINQWDTVVHAINWINKQKTVATVVAAALGDLRVLTYLRQKGVQWHIDTCFEAGANGHLHCLDYSRRSGCPWDAKVYMGAAYNGHLNIMQYAHKQGLEWHYDVCKFAALGGQLECLKYARSKGCPWDAQVYEAAACNGHVHIMRYAHQQGLEWHVDVCIRAALCGQLRCLLFAHTCGCPWDETAVFAAAQNGRLGCLWHLLQQGCPIHTNACNIAVINSHFHCLQLLVACNAPWSADTSGHASLSPDMSFLQYLHDGCPWDERTPNIAADAGHTLEHGCPYSNKVLQAAVEGGSRLCVQYLMEEQGIVLTESALLVALLRGNLPFVLYVTQRSIPFNCTDLLHDEDEQRYGDALFVRKNPDFIKCMECALQRGWVITRSFAEFVYMRDFDNCKELMMREGWFVDDGDGGIVVKPMSYVEMCVNAFCSYW